jgi:hypothetical protein
MRKFLGWLAGILGTVIGGVLLFWLTSSQQTQVTTALPGPNAAPVSPIVAAVVDFQITDELGDGQVTERVVVVIDGRSVGTLTVDTVHQTASLTVTMPRAGRYTYELSSTAVVQDEYGATYELAGYGKGYVQVTGGRSYAVWGDYGPDAVALRLQ